MIDFDLETLFSFFFSTVLSCPIFAMHGFHPIFRQIDNRGHVKLQLYPLLWNEIFFKKKKGQKLKWKEKKKKKKKSLSKLHRHGHVAMKFDHHGHRGRVIAYG